MTNGIGNLPTATTVPAVSPLVMPPRRELPAVMPDELRSIDWCGHMPTAAPAPVTMTRAQVQEQLAATAYDEHVLGFGAHAYLTAFGSAA